MILNTLVIFVFLNIIIILSNFQQTLSNIDYKPKKHLLSKIKQDNIFKTITESNKLKETNQSKRSLETTASLSLSNQRSRALVGEEVINGHIYTTKINGNNALVYSSYHEVATAPKIALNCVTENDTNFSELIFDYNTSWPTGNSLYTSIDYVTVGLDTFIIFPGKASDLQNIYGQKVIINSGGTLESAASILDTEPVNIFDDSISNINTRQSSFLSAIYTNNYIFVMSLQRM